MRLGRGLLYSLVLPWAELVLGNLTLNRIPTKLLRDLKGESGVSSCWHVEKVESWSALWRRQSVNLGRAANLGVQN